ncbi:MAG: VOC family protein [Candidatus Nanopelagicales bacterium]|nr:VOC family protein [Candidatus Nanopelagicales bacterium]
MPASLQINKLVHINQVVRDLPSANAFYEDVFGAAVYWQGYDETERRDASLFLIGDTCIELFCPADDQSLLGAGLARYGESFHSFEWQVPDLDEARTVMDERGIRLTTFVPGGFFMTHPKDTHGMLLEICPLEMGGDLRLEPDWSPAFWADEHPMGIERLNCLSIAVRDLDTALDFAVGITGGSVAYREDRPQVRAQAAGVWVSDHMIELISPTGDDGAVAEYIAAVGPRMRSVDFRVRSVDAARAHLESRGLRVIDGDQPGQIALDPRDNHGVLWQFAERTMPGDPRG